MGIIFRLTRRDTFQVWNRRTKITEFDLAYAPPVKRIQRIPTRGNRVVIALASASELFLVQIEVTQLLVITGGRILENGRLEKPYPFAARKALERRPQQSIVRDHFHHDVDQCAHR